MLDQQTLLRIELLEKQVAHIWQNLPELPPLPPDPADELKRRLAEAEKELARLRSEADRARERK